MQVYLLLIFYIFHLGVCKLEDEHECPISYQLARFSNQAYTSGESELSLSQAALFNEKYFYSIRVAIGVPKRYYKFLLDTGSSDIWITNDTSLSGAPYDYDGDFSRRLSGEKGVLRYMMGEIEFAYARNHFEIGGAKLSDISYGVALQTKDMAPLQGDTSGYMGLGYSSRQDSPSVAEYLKEKGYIRKSAFAISLVYCPESRSDGGIVFGGVDHSKYVGELYKFPREDILRMKKPKKPLAIKLSRVLMEGRRSVGINLPAALDTGATMSYFPRRIYLALCQYFGVDWRDTRASGYPLIDVGKTGDKMIEIDFGGVRIALSGRDFALDYFGAGEADGDQLRVFGIASSDKSFGVPIIGTNILKSMYVVYDLEDEEIAIAQANTSPGASRIEPIVESIPQARYAPFI